VQIGELPARLADLRAHAALGLAEITHEARNNQMRDLT
jgi:hypothetical protein